jgi:hypothetical protein
MQYQRLVGAVRGWFAARRTSWGVSLDFLRVVTSRVTLERPMAVATALAHLLGWREQPSVRILQLGPRHLSILTGSAMPVCCSVHG